MRTRGMLTLIVFACLVVVPQSFAKATFSGKLKGNGRYIVVGLNGGGLAVSQIVSNGGKFKLKFKGSTKNLSVSIIKSDGSYLGPVIFGKKGKKACVFLSGKSANLGVVKVGNKSATAKPSSKKMVSSKCAAKMSKRTVIGAGKLGLVKSTSSKASVAADGDGNGGGGGNGSGGGGNGSDGGSTTPQGLDTDNDGIVNAFDSDSNGNLILNNLDPASNDNGGIFSTLYLDIGSTLNANTGSVSTDQIDNVIRNSLGIVFYFDNNTVSGPITSAGVNCFSVPYCTTATLTGLTEISVPFGSLWSSFDANGDGLYDLSNVNGSAWGMGIAPNATTSQISSGDTYQVVFDTSSGQQSVVRALSSYFVTSTALKSYNAGAGEQTISYPASNSTIGASPSNPIQLSGDSITMNLYRPQRLSIPGAESGSLIDMGHLHYGASVETQTQEIGCSGRYSGLSSSLTQDTSSSDPYNQLFPLSDSADDGAPSSSNSISFSLDIGACIRGAGLSTAGQTFRLQLTAVGEPRPGGVDRTAQTVYVSFP